MDNYYTNFTVTVQLMLEGTYCQGTICDNSKHFPKFIQFSKSKGHSVTRGTIWMAVNTEFSVTVFGWLDGNPVHMISTADGTSIRSVT